MRRLLISSALLAFGAFAVAPTSIASTHKRNDPLVEYVLDSFDLPADSNFHTFKVRCPTGHSAIQGSYREIPPNVAISTSEATGPNGRIWTFGAANYGSSKIVMLVQ